MNRKLFFWLEKLKITPQERITIVSLIILMMVLTGLNLIIKRKPNTNTKNYQAIRQEFKRRTELNTQKEKQLMERYHPKPKVLSTGVRDTLPVANRDSSSQNITITKKKEAKSTESELIDINTATLTQLEKLPGIGPTYAERIISYRKENKEFSSLDELINIKGIGPKRLKAIKPLITIQ